MLAPLPFQTCTSVERVAAAQDVKIRRVNQREGRAYQTWPNNPTLCATAGFTRVLRLIVPALLLLLAALTDAWGLSVGNRVQATSGLNVRSAPAGTSLGSQPSGALGTIVAGPKTATFNGTSYVWWQVNWDNNPDGWSIQDGLRAVAPPAPSLSSPAAGATITGTSVTLSWNSVSGAGAYSVGLRDLTTNSLFNIPLITGTSTTQNVIAGRSYRWDVASCISSGGGDNTTNCPNRSGNRTFSVATSYTISLSASPSAGGTVSGAGTVAAGTSRTVVATANSGYKFTNWTENGGVVSTAASFTFTVNGSRTLVGNFTSTNTNYTITLSPSPSAGGTVGGAGTFPAGSSRTVTATAASGYKFANWTENGTAVSTSASYTFTLTSSRTLVANFSSTNHTITLSGSPTAGGSVTGAGTFPAGSSRTITATANSGYTFVGWTEGGSVVSTAASFTFTLTGNRNFVAAFAFMTSPLACGDPNCAFKYSQGVYTPLILNSVLDHSLQKNPAPSPLWQYGKKSDGGADGIVIGFTGERAAGAAKSTDEICIGGRILLKPTPTSSDSARLTNGGGCPPEGSQEFASYDEHPGYDYRAAVGTQVMAVAAGTVLNLNNEYCYKSYTSNTSGSATYACANWGWVGIDHGNGYISQYGHLSKIYVVPGQKDIKQGQVIGLSGKTVPSSIATVGPHLHFEVFKIVNGQYIIVDPYGWGGCMDCDPLSRYSGTTVSPTRLWK